MSDVATLSPPPAATLVGAIAAVMNEVHTVAKRGVNEFHRYRYATMGDILQEITPLLGRHGIVIFQSETGRAMFDEDNVIAVEYAFTVAHASGETWPQPLRQTGVSTCRNSKGGWDDKALNKCHTAARKYFLLALFQIPTGEEADADQGENDRRLERNSTAVAIPHQVERKTFQTVVPAPSRRLKEDGIAERAIAKRYEQAVQSAGPSQHFRASQAGKLVFAKPVSSGEGKFDERNPPLHDTVPDGAREAATALNRRLHPMNDELPAHSAPPKLDKTERDGVPAFLDRRNGAAEASFLDLVTEGSR